MDRPDLPDLAVNEDHSSVFEVCCTMDMGLEFGKHMG